MSDLLTWIAWAFLELRTLATHPSSAACPRGYALEGVAPSGVFRCSWATFKTGENEEPIDDRHLIGWIACGARTPIQLGDGRTAACY